MRGGYLHRHDATRAQSVQMACARVKNILVAGELIPIYRLPKRQSYWYRRPSMNQTCNLRLRKLAHLVRAASNRHLRNWEAPDALVQEIIPVES